MFNFLKSAMSNTGDVSSNRLFLASVIFSLLGWTSVVVAQTGIIPEIPASWVTVVGIFVGGAGWGKATEVYKAVKAPVETEGVAPE